MFVRQVHFGYRANDYDPISGNSISRRLSCGTTKTLSTCIQTRSQRLIWLMSALTPP